MDKQGVLLQNRFAWSDLQPKYAEVLWPGRHASRRALLRVAECEEFGFPEPAKKAKQVQDNGKGPGITLKESTTWDQPSQLTNLPPPEIAEFNWTIKPLCGIQDATALKIKGIGEHNHLYQPAGKMFQSRKVRQRVL
jgi:hypothetical protein